MPKCITQIFANGPSDLLTYSCIFTIFFFTSHTPLGVRGGCPERCSCQLAMEPSTVDCAQQGLTEFPANITDLVQYLDLSTNVLEEVPDSIALLHELEYLNLARNRLTVLPSSLRGLNKLRKFDLSRNNFTTVSNVASVSQLTSLQVLILAGNPISSLHGLTNPVLEALDFSRCKIGEFANDTLNGMPELTTLSLLGNPLKVVEKPVSKTLRWLDMSDCQLNYLNPDSLVNLSNLEDLRLSNNPMLVFSTRYDTLMHEKLKRLDVSRCNLDRPGLHGFPLLNYAKLSHNLIRFLPDKIFAKNRELRQILLTNNGLDQLNKSSLAGLIKLEVLDLSSNTLNNIHWTSFRDNINLRMLNLSYNNLISFPNFTISATVLDLSSNTIDDVQNNVLQGMPKLKTLDLSNNRVDQIPDDFESQSLTALSLRQNRIRQFGNETFRLLPSLERIDLSGNRLTEPALLSFLENNPSLERVVLDDNPWRCDCEHIYDVFLFLSRPPAKTRTQSLVCQSPNNVSGYSWESACYDTWIGPNFRSKDRAWGMVLITLLTLVVVFGSVVTLRHTMKMKRQAHLERQELDRAEARERLRLLQRSLPNSSRNLMAEELLEQTSEPRINPLELIGPPSYEEAVHMPRLAHSMDALDAISMESVPAHILGSVDNLRSKKRRTRRPRKRAVSDENLARREERRENRRRRASLERNQSTNDLGDSAQSPIDSTNEFVSARTLHQQHQRRLRGRSNSDGEDTSRTRPRPLTPAARVKKRRNAARDGHSSDDEDSDGYIGSVPGIGKSNNGIVIKTLTREPRSGYRPTEHESGF